MRSWCCPSDGVSSTTWPYPRSFSSTPDTVDVSYGQLKQDLAGRTAVVIDVREPWELREYGTIPAPINVPWIRCSPCLGGHPAKQEAPLDTAAPAWDYKDVSGNKLA
ncbi:hypothetical protein CRUP_018898 [Coryphaenoides rupestris]|nr:hypothetical protein CRUP_018898 [Coryphaenoides rupestris]